MNMSRADEWRSCGGYFTWRPTAQDASSVKIFHVELGDPDAPVVLLIHGWPTSSIDWFGVANQLRARFRVCALDFPGYGFSDKPQGWGYSLTRDDELVEYYLSQVICAEACVVVAHDRGDSVALLHAARCTDGRSAVRLEHLVLSNGNIFLPLSNLTGAQRQMLDRESGPQIAAALTPSQLAEGLGASTFTPPRKAGDPEVDALTATFSHADGVRVLHETIQYLVERSQNEHAWLTALAEAPVPRDPDLGPVRHGFAAAGGELCVERILDAEARRLSVVPNPGCESLSAGRPARRIREGAPARARTGSRAETRCSRRGAGCSPVGRHLRRTVAGRGRRAPARRRTIMS